MNAFVNSLHPQDGDTACSVGGSWGSGWQLGIVVAAVLSVADTTDAECTGRCTEKVKQKGGRGGNCAVHTIAPWQTLGTVKLNLGYKNSASSLL